MIVHSVIEYTKEFPSAIIGGGIAYWIHHWSHHVWRSWAHVGRLVRRAVKVRRVHA